MTENQNANHFQKSLVECNDKGLPESVNADRSPPYCAPSDPDNLRAVNDDSLNWLKDQTMQKTGFGARVDCDPMQRGKILNDEEPDRNVIYRYSKSLRGTNEALRDMFSTIVVIDEDGKAWPVPVMLGPPEKAVAAMVQDNVRKDNTLVVDRIKLPMIALTRKSIDPDSARYTYHKALNYFRENGRPGLAISEKYGRDTVLGVARGIPVNIGYTATAWTLYTEDMDQIVEQVLTKFSLVQSLRVTGVPWETIVKLDSTANNLESEPGDMKIRVIKFEFNMTAQTYIPQPLDRKKAVLKMKMDFVDGLSEEEIAGVLFKVEEAVKELQC